MDSEQDDVRKMTELINKQKSFQNNFQLEFQDFVCYKLDYNDDDSENEFATEVEEYNNEAESNNDEQSTAQYPHQVTLTEEEQSVIESCTDPKLKRLLVLNRSKNMQLIKLHKKVKDLLIECEQAIEEKLAALKNVETKQITQPSSIWKLAAPYFKDKKFFPSPLNEDTVRKRSRKELSVYDLILPPKWTPIEFNRLINAVRCNYNTNRQNDIVRKIRILKEQTYNEETEDKSKSDEIISLEQTLEHVKRDKKIPPLNSNEFINWYKVAETFLKDKHTPSECQSVWHILIHPDINKSEWTDEENSKLEAIAKRHSYQNWDEIAIELDTNRTGFTTCLHYFSKLCDKFKKQKFTPDEDKFLLEVVDSYKMGNFIPWNKVVCHFNSRSKHQLYHRYTYFLSQNHVKKGKFTEAEDILLMILVNKFGRNFKKCAQYMPHRSQVQLKSRYNSNLQRRIKKGTFTEEDDKIICEYVQQHGEKNWSGLTDKLNRCNAQIRQRYRLIKAFLHANPDASLSDIPKRRHRFDKVNEDQYKFLSYMVDQYKDADYIPTISMIEESLQVELKTPSPERPLQGKKKNTFSNPNQKKVSVKNIDTMLTDFFSSSMKLDQHNNISEINLGEACNNIEEILSKLGARLHIPEGFECNIHLDNIDVEILENMAKKTFVQDGAPNRLIPPNISTLVGLRSLIIKHKDHKTHQKNKNSAGTSHSDRMWSMEQNLVKLDEATRNDVLRHRELYSRRFDALFNWSAILSLEKPNQIEFPDEAASDGVPAAPTQSRIRKPIEPAHSPVVKKRRVDVTALTNLSHSSRFNNSQLKLIDKSVVERLMQNKNKVNIIRIETTVGNDGIVRPVLPQANTGDAQPVCTETAAKDLIVEDDVFEDVEDAQTSNIALKSEVSNDYNNEEYHAIKDDVQLLKEILQNEKIKMEFDSDTL